MNASDMRSGNRSAAKASAETAVARLCMSNASVSTKPVRPTDTTARSMQAAAAMPRTAFRPRMVMALLTVVTLRACP